MARHKTRWEAASLPWIAEAIAAAEQAYQVTLDSAVQQVAEHPTRPYTANLVQRLPDAALYWMSRTAATVAMDLATRGMPDVTYRELILTSDLPEAGLMIWPKPLASLPWSNNRIETPNAPMMEATWDGMAWIYDDTQFTSYLISRVEQKRAVGALSRDRPSWSPAQSIRLDSTPLDSGPTDTASLVPAAAPIPGLVAVSPLVGQVVAALLALIGQQRIVTARAMSGWRPTTFGSPAGQERAVVLLDVLRPEEGSPRASGPRGEVALRRWFVRGHWRKQPYGPGGTLRKVIYIDLHTAGHHGAPEPVGEPAPRVNALFGQRTSNQESTTRP